MRERRLMYSIALYFMGFVLLGIGFLESFNSLDFFESQKIVIVKLYGPIYYSSAVPTIGGIPAEDTVEVLRSLLNDSHVKAVILDINSPGGSLVGSYVLEEAVKRLAAKKPVIAVCEEECASGAYLVASAADKIYVNPGTLTGSIGVIISYLDFAGYLKKYNITYVAIKSGKYKDMASPYRHLTEYEREKLQEIVNRSYKLLVSIIERNRKLNLSSLPEYIRDGGVVDGYQAIKYRLADGLGSLMQVLQEVKRKYCKSENCDIYEIDTRYLEYYGY
jgi:protease-4